MPEATIGKLVFEKKERGSVTDTIRRDVEVWSCYPPPDGSHRRFLVDRKLPPLLLSPTLQRREFARILEALRGTRTGIRTPADLARKMAEILHFDPLQVDLDRIPAQWRRIEECWEKTISWQTRHRLFEVTVRAKERMKLGGETYPPGDVVAVFRISEPAAYRFVVRYRFLTDCCPRPTGSSVPRDHDRTGEWIEDLDLDFDFDPEDSLKPFRWRLDPERFRLPPDPRRDGAPREEDEKTENRFGIGIRYRF